MVQLAKKRTALFLYSILVVLPTVVFGGLHWRQLVTSQREQLALVPDQAASAARRLRDAISARVRRLLRDELERPFYHYREGYIEEGSGDEISFIPSELATKRPREGVLLYFHYPTADGQDADFELFDGGQNRRPGLWPREEYVRLLREYDLWVQSIHASEWMMSMVAQTNPEMVDEGGLGELVRRFPLRQTAVNCSESRDLACLHTCLAELDGYEEYIREQELESHVTEFNLFLMRKNPERKDGPLLGDEALVESEDPGEIVVLAMREVTIDKPTAADFLPDCFADLARGVSYTQGFFIDPKWLLEEMPEAVAQEVLDPGAQELHLGISEAGSADQFEEASVDLIEDLRVFVARPEDRQVGRLEVRIHTTELKARMARQKIWYYGVSGMMVVSLAIGMGLLVRRVQTSMAEARRTENFVAAVTHELRTPIAAVKMYGEMLAEGWIQSPEKQQDYLERILRETNRLDSLVDRVLQQRQLRSAPVSPAVGDLNAEIEPLIPDLKLTAGTYGDDVVFDLAADLPPVLLVPEGVRAVLVNLVENARKYAAVEKDSSGRLIGEPILVQTRKLGGRVVLEVKDRGPGIPDRERGRIFDAFYRIGDEKTRTTMGTGLGLHIVFLQTRAMRGNIQALSRPGGGTIFRLTFQNA